VAYLHERWATGGKGMQKGICSVVEYWMPQDLVPFWNVVQPHLNFGSLKTELMTIWYGQ